MANATLSKSGNTFTEYPVGADNYFRNNEVVVSKIPQSVRQDIEASNVLVHFTSAKQYITYLTDELTFWETNDSEKKLADYTRISYLRSAISEFQQAVDLYRGSPNNSSNGDYRMRQSIGQLSGGHLYSKTRLAKYFLKNIHKSKNFFAGFTSCVSINRNNSIPSSVDAAEGFIAALEYCKVIKQLVTASGDDILIFGESAKQANDSFAQLNADYTATYHDHEAKIQEFSAYMEQQFQTLNTEAQKYYQEKDQRCKELEALYEEKLKLQAPAEYWAEMDKKYTARGRLWLGVSISVTVLIVALLVVVLAFLPNFFNGESHWFEVFKNSAIITVITSIAVYMLRLFVKLSTSSFHLASDARERNKLTYFYLALIEKKAVTEKERAIILNSLFSRADTGMLKGDSSPTMSGNITELVQNLSKGQ